MPAAIAVTITLSRRYPAMAESTNCSFLRVKAAPGVSNRSHASVSRCR